jgi:aspartate racemase
MNQSNLSPPTPKTEAAKEGTATRGFSNITVRKDIPSNQELEITLQKILEKVLGIEPIGVKDNLFKLGLHDSLTVSFITEIEQTFNISIPLATFLESPTVEELASTLRQKGGQETVKALTIQQQVAPLSPKSQPKLSLQEIRELRISILHIKGCRLGPRSLLVEVEPGVPISKRPFFYLGWGLDNCPGGLGTEQPVYWLPVLTRVQNSTTFIKDLAALYVEEIHAVQPYGPYLLGGECFGARVACEIAQQLQAQGQKVALLVILDCSGTHPLYQRYQHRIYRLTYHWRNLWRLSPDQKLTYLLELAKQIRDRMISKDKKKQGNPDISNDYREQVLKTFGEAKKNYILQPYSDKVALFFGQESGRRSFIFPKGGWGKILTGEVEIHVVPGDHMSYLEEPNVWVLAKKLKACLDKAQVDISNHYSQ